MSTEEQIPVSPEWIKPMVNEYMTKAYNQGIDHSIQILQYTTAPSFLVAYAQEIISQLKELKK